MRPEGSSGQRLPGYLPHLANLSIGYVLFAYTSIPGVVMSRFDVGFFAFGLLMSVILLSLSLAQLPASRLIENGSPGQVLVHATWAHAILAVGLDLAPNYAVLLLLRALWGGAAGIALTAGATYLANTHAGSAATRQQGIYGGMSTFGGAAAYLLTPRITAITGWYGVQTVAVILAVPVLYYVVRVGYLGRRQLVGNLRDAGPDPAADGQRWVEVLSNVTVVFAGLCYLAVIGSYVTLSTFITAYFNDLGVIGPLNAGVLMTASIARGGGGIAADRWQIDDRWVMVTAATAGVLGFLLLVVSSGMFLVVLPFLTMFAVSAPFGAIYNIASRATTYKGSALGFVIAIGNVGSLAIPSITGFVRDTTGSYDGAFVLLAGVNAVAALAAAWLFIRTSEQ
jgi:nitrate/nitrite transporter NarK